MHILQLQKLEQLSLDTPAPVEAVLRSERIQDLIQVLIEDRLDPPRVFSLISKEIDKVLWKKLGIKDDKSVVEIQRYFKPTSILFNYREIPEGDLLKTQTVIDMTTLEERILELQALVAQKTTKEWAYLLENTSDANDYLNNKVIGYTVERVSHD